MTYLPPPKNAFDVEWATQNNRIIQQELGRLQPLQVRVADLESGKQPLDGDLTAIAALTGTGYIRRTADDTWAISATIPNTSITGLGTASTQNTGTSGATIPFLNGNNTWSGTNGFQAVTATTLSTTGSATIGGAVFVGNTASITVGNSAPLVQTHRAGSSGYTAARWTNNSFGPVWVLGKSRGASVGTNAIVLDNDILGQIEFAGDNGSNLTSVGAAILARIDGTPSATSMPTELILQTTPVGSTAPLNRITIAPDGAVSITGTISASNLAGTTYTPTLRGTVDVNIASSTFQSASYIRVGSAVMATIQLFITPTASGSVRFSISLPVASNLTNAYQLGGNCAARDTVPLAGMVIGSATNDNAVAEFVAATTNVHEVTVQLMYPIL